MKIVVFLSTLISLAMISACQKQDPAAEAQLAQQKAELDTREKALDEREKALRDWEKAMTQFRNVPSRVESPTPVVDPEQAKAEREKRIQQLPPEIQALIRDRSLLDSRRTDKNTTPVDPEQAKAERERRIQQLPPELQALIRDRSLLNSRAEKPAGTQDRAAGLQRRLEEARSRKMNAMTPPGTEAADAQSASPVPSPTPE